jgi:F-type H+-transporting ATPase subunit alpha
VVQVYAATNGYLDRIVVAKVDRFLAELTESMRANHADLLEKIASGDWSDETQKATESAVSGFAEDFGFDLDEEGHPIDDSAPEPSRRERRDGDSDEEDQAQAA